MNDQGCVGRLRDHRDPYDRPDARRVVTGQALTPGAGGVHDPAADAWHRFVGTLGDLAGPTTPTEWTTDPASSGYDRDRAEGIVHLARQAQFALHSELDHTDTDRPSLHRYELPWSQWGAPNPDNIYQRCAIDPEGTYLLRGDVSGVHEVLFSVVEGDMHLEQNDVFAEVAMSDLGVGDSGRFQLVIGPARTGGGRNHLVTEPGARMLLVRQYLWDWSKDPVASFTIERSDRPFAPSDPPSAVEVAAALDRATRWVQRSVEYWSEYAAATRDLTAHNTFTEPRTPPGGAPSIAYGGGCFELSPGEVLLVEHEVPDARYWNWSIHQMRWFDSGPWDQRAMSRNGHQVHVDDDGMVRLVVAGVDPGVPNWLDTNGRPVGLAVYRYVGAETKPVPRATVVPLAELQDHLPSGHPSCSPSQRRAELAARREASQRRWS